MFLDRFAGYDPTKPADRPLFIGGNLRGLIEKIPYLVDLGVTGIWVSPFYKTSAYHGYHITDFYEVDPHFGTLEDVQELLSVCHEQGLRVVADFVPNHCSRMHPFFVDAQKDPQSPYRDWFIFTKWPEQYQCFLSVTDLPKLNLNHPPARAHIMDAARKWLRLGFDGFRLDHVIGISHRFWRQFARMVTDEFSDVMLVGEAWMMGVSFRELATLRVPGKFWKWLLSSGSDRLLKAYDGVLDGVLDFRFQEILRWFGSKTSLTPALVSRRLRRHYQRFSPPFLLPSFLDNHDMDRYLFVCNNNTQRLLQAAALQFSQPQPAIVYYGTEVGMTQQQSVWQKHGNGDLLARQPMPWSQQDWKLLGAYKDLIARKTEQRR